LGTKAKLSPGDESRIHVGVAGQTGQFPGREQRVDPRQRPANEQRLLLPVALEEGRYVERSEHAVRVHRAAGS
jgi:hypothetical protein